MNRLPGFSLAGICLIAACTAGGAGGDDLDGAWSATSTTAMSITGDITVTDAALQFADGQRMAWTLEDRRAGDWAGLGQQVEGAIYKVAEPADPTLLRGNTLCGQPVTYIVLSLVEAGDLGMSVFTGASAPSDADGLCASYFYARQS